MHLQLIAQDLGFVSLFCYCCFGEFSVPLMRSEIFQRICSTKDLPEVEASSILMGFWGPLIIKKVGFFFSLINRRLMYRNVLTDKGWWEILFLFLPMWSHIFYDIPWLLFWFSLFQTNISSWKCCLASWQWGRFQYTQLFGMIREEGFLIRELFDKRTLFKFNP